MRVRTSWTCHPLTVNSRLRIEEEEVLSLLKMLDVHKAVGLDLISARLLWKTAPAISRSLTSLFNYSLRSGCVASEWKIAIVIPIPKVSHSEEVSNFRPISVLTVVAKVLEKIVNRQLYTYLHMHSILRDAQSGFRPQHTTQDVLVSTIDDWRQALDKDKIVGSIMLDLSKPFDTISHQPFYFMQETRKRWCQGWRTKVVQWLPAWKKAESLYRRGAV